MIDSAILDAVMCGRELVEAGEAVRREKERRSFEDVEVVAKDVGALAGESTLGFYVQPNEEVPYRMNDCALSQLCSKLDMPSRYVRRLPLTLQEGLFTYELHERSPEKKFMMRRVGMELVVRAVLSPSYSVVNNEDVLAVVAGALYARPEGFNVHKPYLDDDELRLPIMFGDAEVLGESWNTGVMITNSEVGLRTLDVLPYIRRVICSNGMVVTRLGEPLFSRRHRWTAGAEMLKGLADGLAKFFDQPLFDWADSVGRVAGVDVEPVDIVAGMVSAGRLTQTAGVGVIKSVERNGGYSLMDVVNAVSFSARDLEGDTRFDLESLAGDMLEWDTNLVARLQRDGRAYMEENEKRKQLLRGSW